MHINSGCRCGKFTYKVEIDPETVGICRGTEGKTRASALPPVPTFAEAGLPDFEMTGWYGILAPAATPKEVIDKISSEMAVILVMPDIQEYLARQGFDPFVATPEQFAALMKADFAKYANIIKTANIKLEN